MLNQGQGALEYLLMMSAAILLVAIIIIAVTGALEGGQDQTNFSEVEVFDAFHDLRIKNLGYAIEVNAANNSYGSGTAADVGDHCTVREPGGFCAWPILNPVAIFGPTYNTCLDTPSEIKLEIIDLVTKEKTTEILDVTHINFINGETKIFKIKYKGDPDHKHNIRAYFNDCCQSIKGTNIACNESGAEYRFDKNMKVLEIIIKNSDGEQVGSQGGSTCHSSSPESPCYDLNFI